MLPATRPGEEILSHEFCYKHCEVPCRPPLITEQPAMA